VHYTRRVSRNCHVAAVLIACCAVSACGLDSSDLAAFQHSASGPEKLRAILRSPDRDGPLRAEAALRLLDLPRSDVDGRALLFAELLPLDAAGKRAIMPAFKEGLSRRMQTRRGDSPSLSAIRAKDAGAKVLGLLEPDERALLGSELLHFLAEDVPRRADVGELDLEQIAKQIGPSSAKTLVAELRDSLDAESLARLARVIDAHAEPSLRAQAAARLVALERAYRVSPADDVAARERALKDLFLPSLGRFTDQPVLRARLIEIAGSSTIELDQRRYALELLALRCAEAELDPLLALAQNDAAPPELRVLALSRAGEVGNRRALPVMLVLLADRKHHALRRRAGELSLALGGNEVVHSFFRTLPTGWGMNYGKAEIDAYGDQLVKLVPDISLLLLLGEKLHSSFWWNRVMALRYFASRGTAEDVWRIRQHVHDLLPILADGYPRDHTVGLEAESALAMATQRLHASGAKRRPYLYVPPSAAAPDAGPPMPAAPAHAAPAHATPVPSATPSPTEPAPSGGELGEAPQ
jgi:hypothetical protein